MVINFLKANNGDAIYITYDGKNIIIDTGTGATFSSKKGNRAKQYGEFKQLIDDIKCKNEKIDLLIITHWDDDHIGGVLKWFKEDLAGAKSLIEQIWFNSGILINLHFKSSRASEENDILNAEINNPNTSIRQGIVFEKYIIDNDLSHSIISTKNREIDFCDNIKLGV